MNTITELVPVFLFMLVVFMLYNIVSLIKKSEGYKKYLQYKKVKKLFAENHTHLLHKKRELLLKKLANIPVVNLYSENIDQAQDLLNINVVPIEFDYHILQKELSYSQHIIDNDIVSEIKSYATFNQMPMRAVYHTIVSGIDDSQEVKSLLTMRYTKGSFFIPDEFLSSAYIDTLLGRDIVLLGICKIGCIYTKKIQVLLLPYEVQNKRRDTMPTSYVLTPKGLQHI